MTPGRVQQAFASARDSRERMICKSSSNRLLLRSYRQSSHNQYDYPRSPAPFAPSLASASPACGLWSYHSLTFDLHRAICFFASSTTRSGVKPNFVFNALSGADAPNVCITICEPRRPT